MLIKGTVWEDILFPAHESPAERRMLQRHWHDADKFYDDFKKREDEEMRKREARSVAYLDERRKQKLALAKGPA